MQVQSVLNALLGVLCAMVLSSCGDDVVQMHAHAGDPCEDCSGEPGLDPTAPCDECYPAAYDPTTKEFLMCDYDVGRWEVRNECPRGGYARCVDSQRVQLSCVNAEGSDVLSN